MGGGRNEAKVFTKEDVEHYSKDISLQIKGLPTKKGIEFSCLAKNPGLFLLLMSSDLVTSWLAGAPVDSYVNGSNLVAAVSM